MDPKLKEPAQPEHFVPLVDDTAPVVVEPGAAGADSADAEAARIRAEIAADPLLRQK